jgi:Ankyrin repeats (many copies)
LGEVIWRDGLNSDVTGNGDVRLLTVHSYALCVLFTISQLGGVVQMLSTWIRRMHAAKEMTVVIVVGCGLNMASGCASHDKVDSSPQSAAEWRQEQLFHAAQGGHQERAGAMLDQHADINAKDRTTCRTALHLAAANGHDELTAYLLRRGAEVNAQDSAGNTPLHLAAMGEHRKTVIVLLQASASCTIRNKDGKTAAEVAAPRVRPIVEDRATQ